jgi:hypothetical protein
MRYYSKFKPCGRDAAISSESNQRPLLADELCRWLEESRIIPSVRTPENLLAACASPAKIVFL